MMTVRAIGLVSGGWLIGVGLERAAPGGVVPWWVDVLFGVIGLVGIWATTVGQE